MHFLKKKKFKSVWKALHQNKQIQIENVKLNTITHNLQKEHTNREYNQSEPQIEKGNEPTISHKTNFDNCLLEKLNKRYLKCAFIADMK